MGFNFPGVSFDSVSRLVRLNGNIKKVNKKLTGFEIPEYGVTIGIKTEMESKEIVFIVSGKRKAEIFKKVIMSKKVTPKLPASVLKIHPNCHFIGSGQNPAEVPRGNRLRRGGKAAQKKKAAGGGH